MHPLPGSLLAAFFSLSLLSIGVVFLSLNLNLFVFNNNVLDIFRKQMANVSQFVARVLRLKQLDTENHGCFQNPAPLRLAEIFKVLIDLSGC